MIDPTKLLSPQEVLIDHGTEKARSVLRYVEGFLKNKKWMKDSMRGTTQNPSWTFIIKNAAVTTSDKFAIVQALRLAGWHHVKVTNSAELEAMATGTILIEVHAHHHPIPESP